MRNFIQEGRVLTLISPYVVMSGQGMQLGALFGIATSDVAQGASGEFQVHGVFDLVKANMAIGAGWKIYWDNYARVVTSSASGNTLIGYAVQAAAAGDTTARVKLALGAS